MNNKYKFADLFAGCGGLSYGFHKHEAFEQIIAVDHWNAAETTYKCNFPDSNYLVADLSQIDQALSVSQRIPKNIDVLLGGPPCVGFSTLNNSKKHSISNTLVDVYMDIIAQVHPKIFVMENVRGFTSKTHPSGLKYPDHIKKKLSKIKPGYNLIELVINFLEFGVPQNRLRYLLIATRKDNDPEGAIIANIVENINDQKSFRKLTLRHAIGDLPKVQVRGGKQIIELPSNKKIFNHQSMNHSDELIERFKHVPPGGGLFNVPKELLTDHLKKMVDGSYGSGGFTKNIYGRMEWDKPSGTIVAGMDKITCGRFVHPEEHRLLTPRECARIQSFPDDFIFLGGLVTQYYLIGNAVPPKFSATLSKAIFNSLHYTDKTPKAHATNSLF